MRPWPSVGSHPTGPRRSMGLRFAPREPWRHLSAHPCTVCVCAVWPQIKPYDNKKLIFISTQYCTTSTCDVVFCHPRHHTPRVIISPPPPCNMQTPFTKLSQLSRRAAPGWRDLVGRRPRARRTRVISDNHRGEYFVTHSLSRYRSRLQKTNLSLCRFYRFSLPLL